MKKKIKIISLFIAAILFLFFISIGKIFISNIVSGSVHFPDEYIGETLSMEDGQIFAVFRRLAVSGKNNDVSGFAVFKVKFKFKGFKPGTNKRLSMIPAPFLMGMTGFREKYWAINENSNYFQGIYQWESREIAERYPNSFIFKLLTKRSAPGTLSYEIIPNTNLSQYIKKHASKSMTGKSNLTPIL
ncbi:hypothetical protein ACFL0H_04360 [Thermodesulfobacteriota bacterium]